MKPTVARVAPAARNPGADERRGDRECEQNEEEQRDGQGPRGRHEGGRGRDEEVDGQRDAVVHSPDCASRRHARER